ncbi:MAG: helix-turn-helix domain-containing protein [Eggerthella sp.]|nr:helix-turn-helix domain-containing protein [Eggerthella sp.]
MKIQLKQARKDAGYTQEQAAEKTGIALGTLRRWEQGVNEPDMGSIIQLAKLYKTSTDKILGSDFSPLNSVADQAFIDVPLFGSIAAGTPIEMIAVEDTFPVPAKVHEKHPDAFLLKVVGESMNKILPNGCYALVDPCEDVEVNGQPYAVCVNGYDATVKRVDKLANGFRLRPDSNDPTYAEKTYNYNEPDTEQITIIGKVVYYVLPYDWGF